MFDLGFAEMLVIAIVALIVIGPQRLPKAARTLGAFLGRMQRYVADVKADVEREMELEELRKFKSNVEETAREFTNSVDTEVRDAGKQIQDMADSVAKEEKPSSASPQPPQLDLALNETTQKHA
ncbi:MAG: Sec-independent protein translocase protein TatB [Burkholderiales bacterium]